MKALLLAITLVAALLGIMGMVDAIEQNTEARIAVASAFREGCLPDPGETAVIISDGRRAKCRIYTTASRSLGMAPKLISVAAVDLVP